MIAHLPAIVCLPEWQDKLSRGADFTDRAAAFRMCMMVFLDTCHFAKTDRITLTEQFLAF